MFCSRCGTQVKDAAVFCPKCGAKIGASIAPARPIGSGSKEYSGLGVHPVPSPQEGGATRAGNGDAAAQKGAASWQLAPKEPVREASAGGEEPKPDQRGEEAPSKVEVSGHLSIEIATICLAVLLVLCYFMPVVDMGRWGSYSMMDFAYDSNILGDDFTAIVLLPFFVAVCCAIAAFPINRHPMLNLALFLEGSLIFLVCCCFLCVFSGALGDNLLEYLGSGAVAYWMGSLALAVCAGMSLYQRLSKR